MKKASIKSPFHFSLALLVLLALLGSCNHRCHCYGYDASHTYFSEEQLDEFDKTCSGMEYYMNGLLYSKCEYDYTNY